jgi:glycosyltransferase involved in cell wall biosynthesis
MNNLKYYLLFNPELKKLGQKQLLQQFKNDNFNKNIIKSLEDFQIKYPYFNKKIYISFNKELEQKEELDLYIHWSNYGVHNNLISSIQDFYTFYPEFDINFYCSYYNLIENEIDLLLHYYEIGKYKNYITSINDFKKKYPYINENKNNIEFIKNILNDRNIFNNFINNISFVNNKCQEIYNIKNTKNIKVAHLFVHFFKIGGGENFIYNFEKYTNFNNTIFVYDKYNTTTFYNFQSNIIIYNSIEQLVNNLKLYDIIIDHQLYFFNELNAIFNNINQHYNQNKNNILRIIHGVDIYQKNIESYYFYHSINLYFEKNQSLSWNNHIKYSNYLGINNDTKKKNIKTINNDKINICIVGRIDQHKIPKSFLNLLTTFTEDNDHKKYNFHFYGIIDENYEKYFKYKITDNPNIIYKNYVLQENIHIIYEENDILMHPSLNEAGATVILEAMSYGLPIICRNAGGNSETLQNTNYLCNNEEEFFTCLKCIDHKSYEKLFYQNIKKIMLFNNIQTQFNNLSDIILNVNTISKEIEIPHIIHYIYGLKEQKEEFPFLYFISIFSNVIINKPLTIYFHYQYEPYGYWWNKIKRYLVLNYINVQPLIIDNKEIKHYAHKADYLRLLFLYKYGGIYYDIDTICVKSHHSLLNKNNLILGIQENYKNKYDLLCNAIIFCKKENSFIKKWLDLFISKFDENNWCYASMHLPSILYTKLNNEEKSFITILDKTYFYSPNYNEIYNLFDINNISIHENTITYHYWNSNSIQYIENIKNIDYIYHSNSLFSSLLRNINNIYHSTYLNNYDINVNKIVHVDEIYKITIILYDISIDDYCSKIIDIINQQNLFYLDIEIIIIDNNFYNNIENIDNNIDIKKLIKILFYKNIKINIIEYFDNMEKKEYLGYLFTNNDYIFVINDTTISDFNIHNYFFIENIKFSNEKENKNVNKNNIIYYIKKEDINIDTQKHYILNVKNIFNL